MVVATDLIYHTGELRTEWFTGEDLPAQLTEWIDVGAGMAPVGATTEQVDAVAKAYAYWIAYDALLVKMSVAPNSVSIDSGEVSTSYAKHQYDQIAAKVTYWRGVFEAAVEAVSPVVEVVIDNPPRASSSQPFALSF